MAKCKGALFRCRVNNFVNGNNIETRVKYTLLKSKSCCGECSEDGAPECQQTIGFLRMLWDDDGPATFDLIRLPEKPEDGQTYRLTYMTHSEYVPFVGESITDVDFYLTLETGEFR